MWKKKVLHATYKLQGNLPFVSKVQSSPTQRSIELNCGFRPKISRKIINSDDRKKIRSIIIDLKCIYTHICVDKISILLEIEQWVNVKQKTWNENYIFG